MYQATLFTPSTVCHLKFHPDTAARTAKFVHMAHRYFEIFNISSFKQGPLTSVSCPKLTELHMILEYFETEVFSLGLLTEQTRSAAVLGINALFDISEKLFRKGFKYFFTSSLQQDPIEEAFSAWCLRAGRSFRMTVKQFCETERKMQNIAVIN